MDQRLTTTNPIERCEEMAWSLSAKIAKPVQQLTVQLNNGKEYKYASRYNGQADDVVIIGDAYGYDCGWSEETTWGQFGKITDVEPKLTINRNHAKETAYVFTNKVNKKTTEWCFKYITMPEEKAILGWGTSLIEPMSYYTRRILAATSILAFPQFTTQQQYDMAKTMVITPPVVTKEILDHRYDEYFLSELSLAGTLIELPDSSGDLMDCPNEKDYVFVGSDRYIKRELSAVTEFVQKYAFINAICIMVRGGFCNMLASVLHICPAIAEYQHELLEYTKYGHNEAAYKLLSEINAE